MVAGCREARRRDYLRRSRSALASSSNARGSDRIAAVGSQRLVRSVAVVGFVCLERRARDALGPSPRGRTLRRSARFSEPLPNRDSPWMRFRLDRWSLESTGAPLDPQCRYQLGMAEAIIERSSLGNRARVFRQSMASRLTVSDRRRTGRSSAVDRRWQRSRLLHSPQQCFNEGRSV